MKLRLSRDLHDRARVCADAVGDRLSVWIGLTIRARRAGRLPDVAVSPEMSSATRDSAVISLPGISGEDPSWLRDTIAAAVLYCEERNPKPFIPTLVEGRDFIIERNPA
jgi:hypothetical protein